jgi:hypothetical protein
MMIMARQAPVRRYKPSTSLGQDEVISQLYLFRPEPVAERKFIGIHRACRAAA